MRLFFLCNLNGEIHLNAKKLSGEYMTVVAFHEAVHHVRANNKAGYDVLKKFVRWYLLTLAKELNKALKDAGENVGLFEYAKSNNWVEVFNKEKEGNPAKKFPTIKPFAVEQDTLTNNISNLNEDVKKNSFSDAEEKAKLKNVFGFDIERGITVNEDLLEEISIYHPDAEIDIKGNITAYHRTSKESAEIIKKSGIMIAKEDALFFSSRESSYASEYRKQQLHVTGSHTSASPIITTAAVKTIVELHSVVKMQYLLK